jgi:hypothetical protein
MIAGDHDDCKGARDREHNKAQVEDEGAQDALRL